MQKKVKQKASLKRIKLHNIFLSKHVNVKREYIPPDRELYELSFEEFKSLFAQSALQLTNYQSSSAAIELLKSTYIAEIVSAINGNLDGVNLSGIDMIRFRVEYLHMVRAYLKAKKIQL